jgi:hypothetical protein
MGAAPIVLTADPGRKVGWLGGPRPPHMHVTRCPPSFSRSGPIRAPLARMAPFSPGHVWVGKGAAPIVLTADPGRIVGGVGGPRPPHMHVTLCPPDFSRSGPFRAPLARMAAPSPDHVWVGMGAAPIVPTQVKKWGGWVVPAHRNARYAGWAGVWCGVVWCGVVWCGVVWCGMVWCGVVWCGVVWCGEVWCSVVWRGARFARTTQPPHCAAWCGVSWRWPAVDCALTAILEV